MKLLILSDGNPDEIKRFYCDPLGVTDFQIVKIWKYKKKTPVTDIKTCLQEQVYPKILTYAPNYVLVADGEYFKVMAKVTKPDAYIGYFFGDTFKFLYAPSYKQIFYHPEETKEKITRALDSIKASEQGKYCSPGSNIIKDEYYPSTVKDIAVLLKSLANRPILTCDIETYSLKHVDAGLGSICFCWDKHSGCAFKIDKSSDSKNQEVRDLLKEFFINYKGTLIFHNIAFDVTVLIYQLFMKDVLDQEGLLNGLDIMLKNWEDTKLMTYLCTNSCSGNNLGLKYQAQAYAGNWAQDEISNIDKIPEEDLLRYNLIDGLSTWFVYEKYKDTLVAEKQDKLYREIFKPTTKDIIQMQLTGIPLNYDKVLEAEQKLNDDKNQALSVITANKYVIKFKEVLNQEAVDKYNSTHKKQITLADVDESFNPNSGIQIKKLLYDLIKLPVINLTESKQPATDGDTLKALLNHTTDKDVLGLLQALIDYSAVEKILSAFIPTFKKATPASDGRRYIYGNFNLGGTVSGRLSSSKPNLQQIPATGSKYAKLIKSCFQAPKGWLWVGLDYASLEDHISALVTKDPNKLKVYTDEYDGHCLRAYSYWKNLMPDITAQLDEIHKEGKVYKVTYDDGSVEYLNEHNPKLIKLRGNSNESNSGS
mgnify:FL=1